MVRTKYFLSGIASVLKIYIIIYGKVTEYSKFVGGFYIQPILIQLRDYRQVAYINSAINSAFIHSKFISCLYKTKVVQI